jgi:hypothetical protein
MMDKVRLRIPMWRNLIICCIITGVVFIFPINGVSEYYPPSSIQTRTQIIAQETGDKRTFWAKDFSTDTHYELDATLMAMGQYCLVYVEDAVIDMLGQPEVLSRCESYRDEFDDVIYPAVTELTGDPNGRIGDIDGDPRIVILISTNEASYYSQYNEIVHTYSNLCEMIYIYYNNNLILDTIAHEFCHLIWFNYEFDEVHFILEGMAEYATFYAGYLAYRGNVSHRTDYFLHAPDDSLIYFDVTHKDYGGSYLFSFYLAERFGVQFLTDLVQQEEDGALGVETALLEAGYNISFNELYLDWVTALTIDEPDFAENQYGFLNMDVQIQEYTSIDETPIAIENLAIRYYGSEIFRVTHPKDNFTVEISQPSLGLAGVSIAYHDTQGWHVQKNTMGSHVHENATGDSIDTLYIISSLMFTEPSGGNIDFGAGFSDEVDLAIGEYSPTTTPRNDSATDGIPQLSVALASLSAVVIAITIILMYKKKKVA